MFRFIKSKLICIVLFSLLSFSFNIYAINDDPKPVRQFENVYTAVESHKAGIHNLLSNIPDNIQDRKNTLFILSVLKSSIYYHLYWGRIEPDNKMYALGKGNTNGCWVVVLQKDHPKLQTRSSTFNTYKSNGLVHIVVRPDLISKKWAGIFFIHEFVHAYKEIYRQRLSKDETEYNATEAEKIAYNYLTNGDFNRVIDELLKERGINSHTDYMRLIHSGLDVRLDLYSRLETEMGEKKPLSLAEGEMRFALFALSFSIRLSELNKLSREKRISDLSEVLRSISKF